VELADFKKILQGEALFRSKQAQKAVFKDLIKNWSQAMVLPLALRQKLNQELSLEIKAEVFTSNDNKTIKALIDLKDGLKTETVLMRYSDRNTACLSSMVGCSLACEFCATGKMGFKRNLTIGEIIEQVLFFNRYLKEENQKVNSIVFMGMGEPFLNYDNVLGAIRILNDKDYFNIGARRISISTVGIVEGIKKLTEEKLQVNLAISLHAPNDALRSKMMPVNKKYPLVKILRAVEDYLKATRRKIMFEYIMIKDVNDSLENAKELATMLSGLKPFIFMVNLISYNPTGVFKASLPERIKDFKVVLQESKIETTQRYKFGQGIKAACGQLTQSTADKN